MGYLLLGLLFLWGLLMVLKPEILWNLEHSDTIGKKEPSQRYIKTMRIGGIACMVITVLLAIFYYL